MSSILLNVIESIQTVKILLYVIELIQTAKILYNYRMYKLCTSVYELSYR